MKYLCGRCIHIDVCLVPRSTGCVEECKYFKEMPSHLPKQTNEEYLRSCTTEQLAEWLAEKLDYCQIMWYWECDKCTWSKKHESCLNDKEKWVEWLKQPHKE